MSTFQEIIHENIEYREQTLKMAKNDLARTYRASALGWAWAIIKPVITIFVYWFAMSIGLRSGHDRWGYPYFLWLMCGLVPWFYISEMLNRGTDCMRRYKYMITKIHYPVSTIPTFSSLSSLITNTTLLLIVYLIFCIMGYFPGLYSLQIPFYILLMFLFFTSWALFAAPISAISQDFSNLIHSTLFGMLWISGIFYDVMEVNIPIWVRYILLANPITYIVNGFRQSYMQVAWFWQYPRRLAVFLVELVIMFLLSMWSYRKCRKDMPDVL